MEAACRGASEVGGASLGVLLSGRGQGNRWLTERLAESDLPARLRRLRDESQAWIFLPRGLGTLLEIVCVAESIVKGDVAPAPCVFLGEFWRPAVEMALAEASGAEGAARLRSCVLFSDSPAEAVAAAMRREA